MNEQLQQALATMIEKSIKAFEAGADFMAAEIPDVVYQLLLWHGVKSGIEALFAVVVAVVWVVADVKFGMHLHKNASKDDLIIGYGLLGTLARILPFWLFTSLFNLTWLQIWIAPKIFLIEYAARLVK